MKNLRKKIATVTKEEATKELTNAFLEDSYRNIDSIVDWFVDLCSSGGQFSGYTISSFEDYLEKSESEQTKILKDWIFDITFDQRDSTYLNQILEDIDKNKNLSDKEKEIYRNVYYDAARKTSSNKQFLETFRRKLNNYKNWNAKNTINPDFNKGMNKINCICVRLQKKLS